MCIYILPSFFRFSLPVISIQFNSVQPMCLTHIRPLDISSLPLSHLHANFFLRMPVPVTWQVLKRNYNTEGKLLPNQMNDQ